MAEMRLTVNGGSSTRSRPTRTVRCSTSFATNSNSMVPSLGAASSSAAPARCSSTARPRVARARPRYPPSATARSSPWRALGTEENLSPIQQAFIDEQAVQCGYRINGMIMTAQAFLNRNANPSAAEIAKPGR